MKAYKNINEIITLNGVEKKNGRYLKPDDLSIIKNGAIVYDQDKILWVGETSFIPKEYHYLIFEDKKDFILLPEFVDSHTHLVFAGNRASEYLDKLNGVSYQDIALRGGGILATMKATKDISFDELLESSQERVNLFSSQGVGSLEIKSGYALTNEGEYKISLVIEELKRNNPHLNIHHTFMAAHAVPNNFRNSEHYLDEVVIPTLNKIVSDMPGAIDSVDIFHEQGYFNTKDVKKLFAICDNFNLHKRIHADEFNDNEGALLASNSHCLSADHLLCTSIDGIKSLADSNTIATLLPGTALFLGKKMAPARTFLDLGCQVALASDFNPGSCHFPNLFKIAQVSAMTLKMNIAEIIAAITYNAAASLNLKDQGVIAAGKKSRIQFKAVESLAHLFYNW
jgi:imidazolonepropionase